MYKDRLQKALFMVDLQLSGIRGTIAELEGKVTLKEPLPREALLAYCPLMVMPTQGATSSTWNVNADDFVPTGQCDNVWDYVRLDLDHELGVHPPLIPEIRKAQEPALGLVAAPDVSQTAFLTKTTTSLRRC